jgi:hypothetical protein
MAVEMTHETWEQIVARFAAGGDRLREMAARFREDELDARPTPGRWSVREVVVHMQDSDAIGVDRMKRILAEEDPLVLNYDETAYTARLHPEAQPLEDALLLFDVGRRQFARVLARLTDADLARTGRHSVDGVISLRDMVVKYCKHLDHHLAILAQKRKTLDATRAAGAEPEQWRPHGRTGE